MRHLVNESMEGLCRTALATTGLLIINTVVKNEKTHHMNIRKEEQYIMYPY